MDRGTFQALPKGTVLEITYDNRKAYLIKRRRGAFTVNAIFKDGERRPTSWGCYNLNGQSISLGEHYLCSWRDMKLVDNQKERDHAHALMDRGLRSPSLPNTVQVAHTPEQARLVELYRDYTMPVRGVGRLRIQ